MKQVRTSLNEQEFQKFCKLCERLEESHYMFLKKAVMERMAKVSLAVKVDKWLWGKRAT